MKKENKQKIHNTNDFSLQYSISYSKSVCFSPNYSCNGRPVKVLGPEFKSPDCKSQFTVQPLTNV